MDSKWTQTIRCLRRICRFVVGSRFTYTSDVEGYFVKKRSRTNFGSNEIAFGDARNLASSSEVSTGALIPDVKNKKPRT